MKLGVVTAFHSRPLLTSLWAEHTVTFGLPVFCAVTEGDETNIATAKGHGFTFVAMPNDPVGNKMQAALDMAMDAGCERVLILGSDDFVSAEWVGKCLETDHPFIAPDRAAIHHPREGTYIMIAARRGAAHGAGRCVHRSAIEAAGGMWMSGRNKALDAESAGRLNSAGVKCVTVTTKRVAVVDVKSGVNIWPFRRWQSAGHRCDQSLALHMIPEHIRERLPSVVV